MPPKLPNSAVSKFVLGKREQKKDVGVYSSAPIPGTQAFALPPNQG